LNNDVHKLTFLEATPAAIDDVLAQIRELYNQQPEDSVLLLLVDSRVGVPPLGHAVSALRRFYTTQERIPQFRVAYVYKDDRIVLTVLKNFLSALRLVGVQRRFFRSESDHEALQWLVYGVE